MRRTAWGDMLFASREFGRLNNRRTLTHQASIAEDSLWPWLIGLNAAPSGRHELRTPLGFVSARDLLTGSRRSGTIVVGPLATVVLDLGVEADAPPVPATPLVLRATGSGGSVAPSWSAASGAQGYVVQRAPADGGTLADLPAVIDGEATAFTDTSVGAGRRYRYVVLARNAAGRSYPSMEATASA